MNHSSNNNSAFRWFWNSYNKIFNRQGKLPTTYWKSQAMPHEEEENESLLSVIKDLNPDYERYVQELREKKERSKLVANKPAANGGESESAYLRKTNADFGKMTGWSKPLLDNKEVVEKEEPQDSGEDSEEE